uniref:LITAF domain-containing protein n=1 Tax=Angiostrongylus cantonensis TaxID=6313 RepID=A0A0K0CXW8_ANGCA
MGPVIKLAYSDCLDQCGTLVSYCAGTPPLMVCQLNVIVFLVCIFLAVCSGVLIPVSYLVCYVTRCCSTAKRLCRLGHGTDDEMIKLNSRSLQGFVFYSFFHLRLFKLVSGRF